MVYHHVTQGNIHAYCPLTVSHLAASLHWATLDSHAVMQHCSINSIAPVELASNAKPPQHCPPTAGALRGNHSLLNAHCIVHPPCSGWALHTFPIATVHTTCAAHPGLAHLPYCPPATLCTRCTDPPTRHPCTNHSCSSLNLPQRFQTQCSIRLPLPLLSVFCLPNSSFPCLFCLPDTAGQSVTHCT